jgi:integrase
MLVLLDTNVLVSTAIKPAGKPAQIFQPAGIRYELVCTEHVLDELADELGRPHLQKNYSTGYLQIHQALEIVRGGGTRLTETKSERSRRRIRIPGAVLETLRAYVAGLNRSSGFLFTTTVGTPIRGRNLVTEFKGIIDKAGLPEIRFHDLRHSCATLHLLAGTPMVAVAKLLGHSTPALTASVYSHVLPDVDEKAADRMSNLLS